MSQRKYSQLTFAIFVSICWKTTLSARQLYFLDVCYKLPFIVHIYVKIIYLTIYYVVKFFPICMLSRKRLWIYFRTVCVCFLKLYSLCGYIIILIFWIIHVSIFCQMWLSDICMLMVNKQKESFSSQTQERETSTLNLWQILKIWG